MELFLARLFDGISSGATYAAIAVALVLIYKATTLINFAQGELAMLGSFVAYVLAVEQGVPIVLALVIAGWGYAHESFVIREVSVNSPVGVPIWPLKMLIPAAGVLLTLQGIAEMLRAVLCLREGEWPPRMHDVEEMELQFVSREAPEHARKVET